MSCKLGWVVLLAGLSIAGCVSVPGPEGGGTTNANATTTIATRSDDESDARKRARIRTELAMNYYTKGQMQVALDELRNATQADPSYPDAFNAMGLVYMALNDREPAEESFKRALAMAPNSPEVNNNYGWFLCRTGRPEKSIAYFQTALRDPLYTTPAVAARSAGICSMQMKDMAAAQDFLQRSFQADPSNPTTMYHLADLLYRRGDYERARFYAQRLNRQIDVTAQTLWLELRIEHKRGDRESEELVASQLKRRFPDSREYDALTKGAFDE